MTLEMEINMNITFSDFLIYWVIGLIYTYWRIFVPSSNNRRAVKQEEIKYFLRRLGEKNYSIPFFALGILGIVTIPANIYQKIRNLFRRMGL